MADLNMGQRILLLKLIGMKYLSYHLRLTYFFERQYAVAEPSSINLCHRILSNLLVGIDLYMQNESKVFWASLGLDERPVASSNNTCDALANLMLRFTEKVTSNQWQPNPCIVPCSMCQAMMTQDAEHGQFMFNCVSALCFSNKCDWEQPIVKSFYKIWTTINENISPQLTSLRADARQLMHLSEMINIYRCNQNITMDQSVPPLSHWLTLKAILIIRMRHELLAMAEALIKCVVTMCEDTSA